MPIFPRTGLASVQPFAGIRAVVEKLARYYPDFATILPYDKEVGGYPHEKAVVDWLQLAAPAAKLKDIRGAIETLRTIKSPGELAFLKKAINLSLDAHLEAMKMMRPGLYEYQVGAKMVEVHAMGGAEAEGYAPSLSAPDPTPLRCITTALGKLPMATSSCSTWARNTRLFRRHHAHHSRGGKFTPRQREIRHRSWRAECRFRRSQTRNEFLQIGRQQPV
jgi:hypothetical protein